MSEAGMETLQGGGSIASKLIANNMDTRILRPYIGSDGGSYITANSGEFNEDGTPKMIAAPITNANATLTKDAWQHLDSTVTSVFRKRLVGVADVEAAGLTYNMPNGMAHTILQTQGMSDMTDAEVNMDGLSKSDADRPVSDLVNLPLPIVSKDFGFSLREIMASKNGQAPLDTTGASLASKKVAEGIEKLFCGTLGTYTFGGGSLPGLTNYSSALTKSMTAPTASGWSQQTTYDEVLAMRQQAYAVNHFGPYRIYASTSWDQYLDRKEIGTTVNQSTLRENLMSIGQVEGVTTVDHLPANKMILVQMDLETIRIVTGMDVTTVQWESEGGMKQNFKVMAIKVPQLRKDQAGQTGIVVGTHA